MELLSVVVRVIPGWIIFFPFFSLHYGWVCWRAKGGNHLWCKAVSAVGQLFRRPSIVNSNPIELLRLAKTFATRRAKKAVVNFCCGGVLVISVVRLGRCLCVFNPSFLFTVVRRKLPWRTLALAFKNSWLRKRVPRKLWRKLVSVSELSLVFGAMPSPANRALWIFGRQ